MITTTVPEFKKEEDEGRRKLDITCSCYLTPLAPICHVSKQDGRSGAAQWLIEKNVVVHVI